MLSRSLQIVNYIFLNVSFGKQLLFLQQHALEFMLFLQDQAFKTCFFFLLLLGGRTSLTFKALQNWGSMQLLIFWQRVTEKYNRVICCVVYTEWRGQMNFLLIPLYYRYKKSFALYHPRGFNIQFLEKLVAYKS